MKKNLILLLSSFLLLSPTFISCNNDKKGDDVIIPNGGNNEPNEGEDKPGEGDNKPGDGEDKPGEGEIEKPNEGDKEDQENKDPVNPEKLTLTIKEANELCSKVERSYKTKFDETKDVTIQGKVLDDYAISGTYHFIIFADDTGILPILISGNKQFTGKYMVNKSYKVHGFVGNFKNTNCLNVSEYPTRLDDINVDIKKFATASDISKIYEEAYKLYVEENDACLSLNLYKVKATYVSKINNSLMLIFDGTKHIIVHGDNYVNNARKVGSEYEFYLMPSVHQGKRSAEYIDSVSLNTKNATYLDEMKNVAKETSIKELSKIDRYNDEGKLYPFIFKSNCYVSGLLKDDDLHMAFVDDPNVDVKYQKHVNDRPEAIFCKNHVVDDYSLQYSDLYPYYVSDPAINSEFYFVITEYQSQFHAYHGFVINELINKISIEN